MYLVLLLPVSTCLFTGRDVAVLGFFVVIAMLYTSIGIGYWCHWRPIFRDVFEDNMVEAKARGLQGQGQRSSRPEVFEAKTKATKFCPRGRGQSTRTPSLVLVLVSLFT